MPYRLNANLNPNATIAIETDNLEEMVQALHFFRLIEGRPNPVPREVPTMADIPDGRVNPTSTPVMEAAAAPAPKRRKGDKPADTQAAPEAGSTGAAAATPATESPSEGNAPAAAPAASAPAPATPSTPPAPAPAPAPQAAASSTLTPAQAAEAVRGYGAKHGIVEARSLLAKHGLAKTSDITDAVIPALMADIQAADL